MPVPAAATWFTQEVSVPEPLRLGRYSEAGSSNSSSTSSLELEVSRLAQALRRIQAPVNITAVDYCKTRARFYSDLDGSNLGSFLSAGRPTWSAVRWLVVDGVSGDVLQTLAEHYDLHPLAIEDVMSFQRIKSVSYPGHIYSTAHIWQLKKFKGLAADLQSEQQQAGLPQEQQEQHLWESGHGSSRAKVSSSSATQQPVPPAATAAAAAAGRIQPQQDWRVDVVPSAAGPVAAAAAGPAAAAASTAAAEARASQLLDDSSSDDVSSIGSLDTAVCEEAAAGKHGVRLEYETDEEDEGAAVGAREKVGGCTFADHPHAHWAAGWRGSNADDEGEQHLNRQLLQHHHQQQQQQRHHHHLPFHPHLHNHHQQQQQQQQEQQDQEEGFEHVLWAQQDTPEVAAAALSPDTISLAGSSSSAAAAAAAAAAGAACGPVGGYAGAAAGVGGVKLVLPLHSSAFNYRPTRSALKKRRFMMQQVSLFLHSSGVLISIFPGKAAGGGKAAEKVAGPILRALRGMSSLLLESEDAGFLMQALLRSCISTSLPVFSRIADLVSRLDGRVLEGRAHMKLTRRLHVLFIDLSILTRSFQPMQTLLQALAYSSSSLILSNGPRTLIDTHGRGSSSSSSSSSSNSTSHSKATKGKAGRSAATSSAKHKQKCGSDPHQQQRQQQQQGHSEGQDADAAGHVTAHTAGSTEHRAGDGSRSSVRRSSSSSSGSSGGDEPVEISSLARTYLEDLQDQAAAVSADLAALAEHVAHLSELVVQTVGHDNENANMTLAVIGTVFLPLTWIAGIYGMNFDILPELHWTYGYLYFYMLCVGVMLLALALMWRTRLFKVKVKQLGWVRRLRVALRRLQNRLAPGRRRRTAAAAKARQKSA